MNSATAASTLSSTGYYRVRNSEKQKNLSDYARHRNKTSQMVTDFVKAGHFSNQAEVSQKDIREHNSKADGLVETPPYSSSSLKALIREVQGESVISTKVANESAARSRAFLIAFTGFLLPVLMAVTSYKIFSNGAPNAIAVSTDASVIQVDGKSSSHASSEVLSLTSSKVDGKKLPSYLSLNNSDKSKIIPLQSINNISQTLSGNSVGWLSDSGGVGSKAVAVLIFKANSSEPSLKKIESIRVNQIINLQDEAGKNIAYQVTSVKNFESGKLNVDALLASSQAQLEVIVTNSDWQSDAGKKLISAKLL